MVIVDTTVWIDYLAGTLNPETDWLDRELEHQRLGLTDLISARSCRTFGRTPMQSAYTASSPTSKPSPLAAKP